MEKTIYVCGNEKENKTYIACVESNGTVFVDGWPIQAYDNLKNIGQEFFNHSLAGLPRDLVSMYNIQGLECNILLDVPPKEISDLAFVKLPSELGDIIEKVLQEEG